MNNDTAESKQTNKLTNKYANKHSDPQTLYSRINNTRTLYSLFSSGSTISIFLPNTWS